MLNEMRFGRLTPKSIAKFRSLSREIQYEDGLGPTELYDRRWMPLFLSLIDAINSFPRREDVDRSNSTRMSLLPGGKEHRFQAVDGGAAEPTQREKLLSNLMAPIMLTLRKDAQVLLIYLSLWFHS